MEAATDEIAASEAERARAATRLSRWQRGFAPFLAVVVTVVAVFFFAASYAQFESIKATITAASPTPTLAAALRRYEAANPAANDFAYLQWQNKALLDERAQQARIGRSSAALLVNVWTRYLGFVTGMVLAITGATFIMAKLSEGTTSLEGKSAAASTTLSTSSPGIVLAVLGTALMLAAMTISFSESGEEPILSAASDTGAPAPAVPDFLPKPRGPATPPARP